jgi:deoxyribodipyrimidine photolyase-related protein
MIAALIYPHQLFPIPAAPTKKKPPTSTWIDGADQVYVIEDPLFFTQYPFHRQKLMLHRASMRSYADRLRGAGRKVTYVEATSLTRSGDIAKKLRRDKIRVCRTIDPDDEYLGRRLVRGCSENGIELEILESPHFLTSRAEIDRFVENKKKLFFTNFYIEQRKRLGILLDEAGKAAGGKWSFDTENRRKLPAKVIPPELGFPTPDEYAKEARAYVDTNFPNALGESQPLWYPHDEPGAKRHLECFIDQRLASFGDYEDAISRQSDFVFHSVLTPMLNIGLLNPSDVVARALEEHESVSMNSLEGFVRQVIGWREYMRLVYRHYGVQQRTKNYWQHHRTLPKSFYDGTTGIEPVDHSIRRVLKYGYCHHIERLMVLGNFMLLCEFSPDAIYQWFMEMFVDAYDWVMVPNVYGMSQHADGGMITTKPYISGSAYVLKMSDFKKGDWCPIWDALYWNFIAKHRDFFSSNPRMSVMTGQLDRMGDKLQQHQRTAEAFLSRLD